MLDDLMELILDVVLEFGGEAAKVKKQGKKKRPLSHTSETKPTKQSSTDPWDRPEQKPPWEQ